LSNKNVLRLTRKESSPWHPKTKAEKKKRSPKRKNKIYNPGTLSPWVYLQKRGGPLRINYSGNKKRREEANRKKQEEKRNKRLNKSKDRENPGSETPVEAVLPQELPPQS